MEKVLDNTWRSLMMKVIRVTRAEFELENGQVFPIDPPLQEEMTPSEFQKHYDFAVAAIQGRRPVGGDHKDSTGVG